MPVKNGRSKMLWDQLLPSSGAARVPGARLVPIAAIVPNPHQPRKELHGIPELAASIEAHGLLQPVVVTPASPASPGASGRHTLLFGHRRVEAYRHLFATHAEPQRWTEIWAVERETHSDDYLVLALLENLSREGLSDAEVVTGLRLLHDLRKWHQAEIARQLGVSKVWISRYFTVAADAELSEHVQAGQLSIAKAYEVRNARTPDARSTALALAVAGGPLREIRRVARHARGPASQDSGADDGAAGQVPPFDSSAAAPGAAGRNGAYHGASDGAPHVEPARAPADAGATAATAATAALDAGVRDLAEVARALDVTFRLGELQLAKLIKECLRKGTDRVDGADFIRLLRADLRTAEAHVRAAAAQRRAPAV